MRRIVQLVAVAAAIVLTGTWTVTQGQTGPCSYPGCPDPTFGGTGIVVTPSQDWRIDSLAVQRIGGDERVVGSRVLTGGALIMARYTGTGQLDTSFGTAGVMTRTFGKKEPYYSFGIAAQHDNKLLVLNHSTYAGVFGLAVTRYLPNPPSGSAGLDTAFGSGGTAFLGSEYLGISPNTPMAIQSDGKIVVASHIRPNADHTVDLYVHRITAAGLLDGSFGTGGVVKAAGAHYENSVVIQPVPNADGVLEDRIVVASSVNTTPDVIGGGAHYVARLQRFMPDGSPDTTFGVDGATTLDIPGAGQTNFYHLAVDTSGRILAAGNFINYLVSPSGTITNEWHVLVARYTADGTLDSNFADWGIFRQDWLGDNHNALGVAVHPDGRVLIVGRRGTNPALSLVIWRLLDNGVPDLTFGSNGTMTYAPTDMTCGQWGGPIFVKGGTAFVVGGSALYRKGKGAYSTVQAVGRFIY